MKLLLAVVILTSTLWSPAGTPHATVSFHGAPDAVMQVPASAGVGTFVPLSAVELAVAACESGHRLPDGSAQVGTHRWRVENPSPRSSASGAFQFVDGTWVWVWEGLIGEAPPSLRAKDASASDQLRAFRALWREGEGAHHWEASYGCWSQMM